jgi:hypothetical protein
MMAVVGFAVKRKETGTKRNGDAGHPEISMSGADRLSGE